MSGRDLPRLIILPRRGRRAAQSPKAPGSRNCYLAPRNHPRGELLKSSYVSKEQQVEAPPTHTHIHDVFADVTWGALLEGLKSNVNFDKDKSNEVEDVQRMMMATSCGS